jgi:hypothetical protein
MDLLSPARGGNADDEKALKEDLRKLQGKWEHNFKNDKVNANIRKVKEIKGNKESVTWYDPDGKIVAANKADFKLEIKGKQRVFSWSNGKIVDSEYRERPFQDGSFVYKLEGDKWIEMLPAGKGQIVWRRVKEKK